MKKTILTILITAIICITGTVIASNYLASEIVYKDTTVDKALDELYTVHETYKNLSTDTTVTSEKLLDGVTAYNKNGELVTGNINTDCVNGIYHHNANTQLNITFPFAPKSLYISHNMTNEAIHIFYNSDVDDNVYMYAKSYDQHYNVNTEYQISSNKLTSNLNTARSRYTEAYDLYYTICR